MSTENLTAYLREHAAGAAAALDLIDHHLSHHADTSDRGFYVGLLAEVKEDKAVLDEVLQRFQTGESTALNTLSWISERFARLKFRLADPREGGLGRLEALEMLSVGIEAKKLLWLALEAAARPELQDLDLTRLVARAAGQRERVEQRRLHAARGAFSSG